MEEAIFNDANSVLKFANEKLNYPMENIILIGRSLGSGIATKIASEYKIKGLILISAYTSIREAAKYKVGGLLSKFVGNMFRTIDIIDKVECPILFIHGSRDDVIPCNMSIELHKKATAPKELKLNPTMSHN